MKATRFINRSLLYLGFLIFTLIVLLPVYWMARSAFANVQDLYVMPLIYFPAPNLNNIRTLMEQVPLFQYNWNSFLFAISTTPATLVVSYLAAYAFARMQFWGSGLLMWILVLSSAL